MKFPKPEWIFIIDLIPRDYFATVLDVIRVLSRNQWGFVVKKGIALRKK